MNAHIPPRQDPYDLIEQTNKDVARRASVNGIALGAKALALLCVNGYVPGIESAETYEELQAATGELVAFLKQRADFHVNPTPDDADDEAHEP